MKIRKATELRRGMRISMDGNWLELIRVNPTSHPVPMLQLLFLNGRSVLARPDEEFVVKDD